MLCSALCRSISLGVLLTILVVVGCGPANEFQPPPPPEVTVAHPEREDVEGAVELTGVTEVYERVDLRARVKGFLEKASFVEGEEVKAGQVLFEIDPRPFQADLDAAKAALLVSQAHRASADANLTQAKTQAANDKAQYDRAARAAQSGAVTQAELDERLTKYDNAVANIRVAEAAIASSNAEIKAAEATVEQEKLNLSYTKVVSPIAGRVGRRAVDVGNLVGSNESTLLTTVIRYEPIYASFTISEAEYLRFARARQEETGSSRPSESEENRRLLRLSLADEEDFPHEGRFNYADLGVDEATGTYLVRGVFPNPGYLIPPGAFVRIRVPLEVRSRLLLPDSALGRDQNGAYVAVVDGEGVVSRKRVVTGRLHEGKRVVKEGLTEEDVVVVIGLQKARPGSKVTVVTKGEGGTGKAEREEPAAEEAPQDEG